MTDEKISPDEIEFTPDFKRSLRALAKKYRSIRLDVQLVIDQIREGKQLLATTQSGLNKAFEVTLNSVSQGWR